MNGPIWQKHNSSVQNQSTHLFLRFIFQTKHISKVMSCIKVHGTPLSTAAARVLATVYEKEVEFEFVPIDMRAGEHKKESFTALNPFGQVPAFEDGDLQLFESRAITQYITHEYASKGTQMVVADSKKMAIVAVWNEVEAHHFDPAASKLTFELAIKPLLGMVTDLAVVEEFEAKLAAVLDVYEKRLGQSKYLGGDFFSLADLHHLPTAQYLMDTRAKKLFDCRPNVSAWVTDILARPAWLKVVAMRAH